MGWRGLWVILEPCWVPQRVTLGLSCLQHTGWPHATTLRPRVSASEMVCPQGVVSSSGVVHGLSISWEAELWAPRPTQAPTPSHSLRLSQGLGSQPWGTPVFWECRPLPSDPWPQTPVVRGLAGGGEQARLEESGQGRGRAGSAAAGVPPRPPETSGPSPEPGPGPQAWLQEPGQESFPRGRMPVPAAKGFPFQDQSRCDCPQPGPSPPPRPTPSLL